MQFIKSVALVAALGFSSIQAAPTGSTQVTGCTGFSGAAQPVDTFNATNRLPAPSTGLSLVRVVLGVGTQNYTCSTSDATATPVAIGALAILYDASCAVSTTSAFLDTLPPVAVQSNADTELVVVRTVSQVVSSQVTVGVHYFRDKTTPIFDFQQRGGSGLFVGAVNTKMPAPIGSNAGKAPTAYGAVPWLKLTQNAVGGSVGITEAFRLVTAGGSPPATCQGQASSFQVPYAAEYWFYN